MRAVLFIQDTVKENGEYIACIAKDGGSGYYKTDWAFGKDKEQAQAICDERNIEQGFSKEDALKIVLSTMAKGK